MKDYTKWIAHSKFSAETGKHEFTHFTVEKGAVPEMAMSIEAVQAGMLTNAKGVSVENIDVLIGRDYYYGGFKVRVIAFLPRQRLYEILPIGATP